MAVRNGRMAGWLLLTFTLPAKRASQRVEIWRKLQRYGTVPLGNSGYLLPNNPSNEERFQWLATAIRKYGGDASVVHVASIDNLSKAQLIGRCSLPGAAMPCSDRPGHASRVCAATRGQLANRNGCVSL